MGTFIVNFGGIKANKAKWTAKVPVLSPDDIFQDAAKFADPTGTKHDLTGWRDEIFLRGKHGSDPADPIMVQITETLRKHAKKVDKKFNQKQYLSQWCVNATKEQVCEVWNNSMKELGYTVQKTFKGKPYLFREKK